MTPMSGTVDVDWSVLTMAPGSGIGESRLKLPPFAKDVFDIYGIPFLFKVDEALIFKPGFGGKKDVADGNFHVVYTGSGGLTIHGSQSAPEGKMEGQPQNGNTTAESLAAARCGGRHQCSQGIGFRGHGEPQGGPQAGGARRHQR
jgi:hypothetical protein